MDGRQLRYFQAVCDHRNVSHAANRLNVAQSALSTHISNLEEELGLKLFHRKPRGMEPTAAGLRLYEHARSIIRAMEQAQDDLRSGASNLTGEISVGMPFSVIKVIGVDLLGRMMRDHPNVRLLLTESLSGIAYTNLIKAETDLAVTYNPPPDKVTLREALLEEELFCIGRPEMIGSDETPVAFDHIADFPLALLRSGTLSRALIERSASLARLERHAKLQLASIAATLGALEAGLACTIAPKVLLTEQLRSGILVARPIVNPTPVRTLYLLARSDARPTHLSETVTSLIRELATRTVADGRWTAARALV